MHQVQPPLNRILQNRRHFTNKPVERPVGGRGQTCTLGTNAHGQNLWRVQPRNGTPREAECCVVKHDEQHYQPRRESNVDVHEVRDGRERNNHGGCTEEQNEAATEAIDEVPWRNRRHEVCYAVNASHEECIAAMPASLLKDERSVV
jgi:hypothetical protein